MKKYSKVLFFCIITLFSTFLIVHIGLKTVYAENDDFLDYIDNILDNNYHQAVETKIKENFPSFDISASEFDSIVTGEKHYRILEITPRTFMNNISEISDLETKLETIKNHYKNITIHNNYTDQHFISNMTNFSLDVMTIKQFVDNRDELDGKYDAIFFASGNYSPTQVISCAYDPEPSESVNVQIYDQNHRLRYAGGTSNGSSNLETAVFHGYGQYYDQNGLLRYAGYYKDDLYHGDKGMLYDQNGRLRYDGGWINGKRNCYGVEYDQNGLLRYMGQWKDDEYHGYGKSWDQNGRFEYEGYFENGEPSSYDSSDDILNDITENKADAIIADYVEKDLPVFIDEDVISNSSSVLYQKFSSLSGQYSNVFMMNYDAVNENNNIDYHTIFSIMNITQLLSTKPNITFNEKPIDYKDNPTHEYEVNDIVNFDFELTNKDNATLLYYIDINQNDHFEEDEIAYTLLINRDNNHFTFEIPTVYSGLLRYKIVVNSGDLSSLYEGVFKVKGEYKEIKVLNVVSKMVDEKDGLLDDALYNEYFQNNDDYKITLDRCNIKEFSKNNSKKWDCSHYVVMDNYDVILLGQDIFDKPMNVHVYNSIQEQIDSGKPMIFTASVTKGNKKWVNYFQDDLALSDYRTDLYKLNHNVDKMQIVNDDNLTLYPFNMKNEELTVPDDLNYALNEQYQLDLNDEKLVPLMNMYSSTNTMYDRYDSYNNFYFYKNENVIYLNVGNNSFKTYKDIEHKLLVNSIVNSYTQHKAKDQELGDFFYIDYTNDYENALIDMSDPLEFSFSVFSNKDDTYQYTLYANYEEIETSQITNNQLVNINLNQFSTPNLNTINQVYVSVVIENSEQERHTYSFYVFVGNLNSYNVLLHPTRLNNSLIHEEEKYLQVDSSENYSNTYKVELNPIQVNGLDVNKLPENLVIRNMMFKQDIPDNITIDDLSYTIVDGTLTRNLGDFTYTLVGNAYEPDPYQPINFTVPFTVDVEGEYTFEPASLTFNGIGSDSDTIYNSNVTFNAVKPLDYSMVNPVFEDYLFIPFGEDRISDLTKKFIISDQAIVKSIHFNTDGNVLTLDNKTLDAHTIGEEDVEIVVEDIFGNVVRKSFLVKSYVPITSIDLEDQSLYVGDELVIPFTIDTDNIQFELIEQTIGANVVDITRNNNQFVVTGLEKGYAQYRFYGYDRDGYVVDTVISFVVNEKLDITFNEFFYSLFIGEQISQEEMNNNLELSEEFIGSTITWTSSDETIASVASDGTITAHVPGTVVITATLPNNSSAQLLVKVYDYMGDNSGFDPNLDTVKVYQGYKQFLEDYIRLYPDTLMAEDVEMIFTIEDPNSILEYFDPTTNTFNTKVDQFGEITIHVTINQYDRHNQLVKTVSDTYILTIREIVDPNIDSGDNTH